MRINNNITAINAHRQYGINNAKIAGSVEKLSSGYRINRAGDDAAGLAISEKMRAQIRGLEMASKNSSDAISLVQTAEGALQETHNILQRMRELAVQSASDTNESTIDRAALDAEFQQLKEEIDEIARTTRFNDQNLIDGTFQKAFYSTDITAAQLTDGTQVNVSRVGVKSNHNMDGTYDIDVKYIEGKETVYARKSEVDMQVSTEDKRILLSADKAAGNGTSIINRVDFDAVVGAEHNGKTFTLSASGEGNDLSKLVVKINDGDSTWEGTVKATSRMQGGSEITVSFDGVGTMTLFLDEDIAEKDQNVYNISSALNNKQFKFIEAYEVEKDAAGNEIRKGLGAADAYPVEPDSQYAVTATTTEAGVTISVTDTAIDSYADLIKINPAALTQNLGTDTSIAFSTDTVAATVDGKTFNATVSVNLNGLSVASGNFGGNGSVTFSFTLTDADGKEYGTYNFDVAVTGGSATSAAVTKFKDALTNFTGSIQEAPPAYSLETNFDYASAGTIAKDSSFAIDDGTVAVTFDATTKELAVDASGVTFEFTDALGDDTRTLGMDAVVTNAPNGPSGEINISFNVYEMVDDGSGTMIKSDNVYGTFEMHIGAQEGRDADDLDTTIKAALENISQDLGKLNKGVDSVKATDAAIALTLNGEVVELHENDKTATFDSSGISMSFNALDFSDIKDNKSATAKFTKQGGTDGSEVFKVTVEEAAGKALTVQTGANQGDELKINIDAMNLELLGLTNSSIATQKSSSRAITEVNNAINQVSTQRAALGALQNRLNHKIANLDTSAENLQAAESRIRDVDMAKEMTEFTKNNILSQASTAMLAQANALPQGVLQLLG